eukprot:1147859-Pelagomonas_calceolata.AAC.7
MAAGKQAGVQNCLGDWQGQSWRRSSPSRHHSLQIDTGANCNGLIQAPSLQVNTGAICNGLIQAPSLQVYTGAICNGLIQAPSLQVDTGAICNRLIQAPSLQVNTGTVCHSSTQEPCTGEKRCHVQGTTGTKVDKGTIDFNIWATIIDQAHLKINLKQCSIT